MVFLSPPLVESRKRTRLVPMIGPQKINKSGFRSSVFLGISDNQGSREAGVPVFQEGRKPNWKSETELESPKTEPVAVYKETGETRNRRNRNRGLQKVVPLHRPEVGQIKSCRGLSTTIRKRSARSTKWAWFQCLGFPRGLEEAGFLVFWFLWFPVLKQLQKKTKSRQGHHSRFKFLGCKKMQGSNRIGKQSKRKRKRERGGVGGPLGAPGLAPPLSCSLPF